MIKSNALLYLFLAVIVFATSAFGREGFDIKSIIPTEQEAAKEKQVQTQRNYESPASRARANRARETMETERARNEERTLPARQRETTRQQQTKDMGRRYQEPPGQTRYQRNGAVIYSGNTETHKFHHPDCRYYYCKSCTRTFNSRQEALNAGFSPCLVCGAQ